MVTVGCVVSLGCVVECGVLGGVCSGIYIYKVECGMCGGCGRGDRRGLETEEGHKGRVYGLAARCDDQSPSVPDNVRQASPTLNSISSIPLCLISLPFPPPPPLSSPA